MLTGLVLGIGGWFLGAWIGGQMAVGHPYLQGTDQNDVGIYMGYLFGVIGWLIGLGFANYPSAGFSAGHRPCGTTRPGAGPGTSVFAPTTRSSASSTSSASASSSSSAASTRC